MLRELLNSGKFISVDFVKANGEKSKVSGRAGVKKYTKGGASTIREHKEYITLFDLKRGYRNVNVNNITAIRANGKEFNLS